MKDFISEEQTRNYKDLYKNFTDFINILNLSLLAELNGNDAAAAQNPNVESSSSINRYFSRTPKPGETKTERTDGRPLLLPPLTLAPRPLLHATDAHSVTMVTAEAAMAVPRAARPFFRGAHDGLAFAANVVFLADGYSYCAVGPSALNGPLPAGVFRLTPLALWSMCFLV